MSKAKLEKKLKVGNWDGQGRKQGRTASNRASKRNKKRSVKAKLDKLLIEGQEPEKVNLGRSVQVGTIATMPSLKPLGDIFADVKVEEAGCQGRGYFIVLADPEIWDVPTVRVDCKGCRHCKE